MTVQVNYCQKTGIAASFICRLLPITLNIAKGTMIALGLFLFSFIYIQGMSFNLTHKSGPILIRKVLIKLDGGNKV